MNPSYNTLNSNAPQQYYSTEPPLNSSQHFQQPQSSYLQPNTENNNLNELDKGWFRCYKIAFFFEALRKTWNIMNQIYQYLWTHEANFNATSVISLIFYFAFIVFILMQFVAIKNRDLKTAKIALICHLCYLFASIVYQIIFLYAIFGYLHLQLFFSGIIWTAFSAVCIIPGSFKVLQFLNANRIKCEADHYQSYYKV